MEKKNTPQSDCVGEELQGTTRANNGYPLMKLSFPPLLAHVREHHLNNASTIHLPVYSKKAPMDMSLHDFHDAMD